MATGGLSPQGKFYEFKRGLMPDSFESTASIYGHMLILSKPDHENRVLVAEVCLFQRA